MTIANITPDGNSETSLIARLDGGTVQVDVTESGKITTTSLTSGDVIEITTETWGNHQVSISETRVTLIRSGQRQHLANFRGDSSWGGYGHRHIVDALRPVADAVHATIVEQQTERRDQITPVG